MRCIIFACAALVLGACGQSNSVPAETNNCARSATHTLRWSNADADDVIVAHAEGPSCAQAVVSLVARSPQGDPLLVFASSYHAMRAGEGGPIEAAQAVTDAEMDEFLANWANVTEMRSSQLPQWRADAASLAASVEGFSYTTPFEREAYEMLRGRDLPMICFAAGVETSQCLLIDPLSNAPGAIVTYGP